MYHVKPLLLGPHDFPNFVYLVSDSDTRDAVLIDPAWDARAILDGILQNQLTLRAILLTHSHSDHVDMVTEILHSIPVPVYMSQDEIEFSKFSVPGLLPCHHQEQIQAGSIEFSPLSTPGHTVGSVCYLLDDMLFTGDTLFIEGCGHCNSPGSSPSALFATIQFLRKAIPDSTAVYPGHRYAREPGLTMGQIKKGNVYLNISDEERFIDFRMRRSPAR